MWIQVVCFGCVVVCGGTHWVIFEGGALSSPTVDHHLSGELLEGRVHVDIVSLQLHLGGILHLLH